MLCKALQAGAAGMVCGLGLLINTLLLDPASILAVLPAVRLSSPKSGRQVDLK